MKTKTPLPDEQPVTINALRNKRAKIAGQIALHEADINRLRADLIHLDSVLRLFDPELNPEDIAAQKRFPRRTEYFARGEMSQRVFDALRSVSANELAAAAPAEKVHINGPPSSSRLREPFPSYALPWGRRGHAVRIRKGVRWKLAPRERDPLDGDKRRH